MLADPVMFVVAGVTLLLSNLVSWPILRYLASQPVLSHTVITHLNTSLVHAYNLHTRAETEIWNKISLFCF